MNFELHLLLSTLLVSSWVVAVIATHSIQQRNAAPGWIENVKWVRLLSAAYSIVLIGTLAYYLALPIIARSPLTILIALVPVAGVYIITFRSTFATVRETAGGRALSVALFGILAAIVLPIGILWFNAAG